MVTSEMKALLRSLSVVLLCDYMICKPHSKMATGIVSVAFHCEVYVVLESVYLTSCLYFKLVLLSLSSMHLLTI